MRKMFFLLLPVVLFSCGSEESEKNTSDNIIQGNVLVDTVPDRISAAIKTDTFPKVYPNQKDTSYSYKITRGEKGYGYEIFHEGKLLIRQPHIPAVEGNQGFSGEKDASTVASFVIEKLKKGISPPSVSTEELTKLGILEPEFPKNR